MKSRFSTILSIAVTPMEYLIYTPFYFHGSKNLGTRPLVSVIFDIRFRLLAAKAIDIEAQSTQQQCLKTIYHKWDSNICLGRVCDSASRRYALLVDLRDAVRDAAVCCVSACVIGLTA